MRRQEGTSSAAHESSESMSVSWGAEPGMKPFAAAALEFFDPERSLHSQLLIPEWVHLRWRCRITPWSPVPAGHTRHPHTHIRASSHSVVGVFGLLES